MGLVMQELDYCLSLGQEHMAAGIEVEKANQSVRCVALSVRV